MTQEPPAPAELETDLSVEDGRALLRVSGEVDLLTAPRLDAALADGLGAGRPLTVDLRGVTFIESSGLRSLLEARRRADGAGPVVLVVRPEGVVARLLGLTGVTDLFEVRARADGDPV